MKKLMQYILLVLTAVLFGCHGHQERNDDVSRLDRECAKALAQWEKPRLDSLADTLATLARESGSYTYQAKSEFYKGSWRQDEPDQQLDMRERHLTQARNMAERSGNDTLLCRIYNTMGLWEMHRRSHYATAQYYFNKAMALARNIRNRDYEIAAETNMSEAMRMLGDTMGFSVDKDIFNYAGKKGNLPLMVASGLHCAEYLALTANDTTQLYPYIEPSVRSGTYADVRPSIYAKLYYHKHDFEKALRWIEQANTDEYVDLAILRARILSALGRHDESMHYLRQAVKAFEQGFSAFGIEKIFDMMASNCMASGDIAGAYRWQKRYAEVSDSLNRQLHSDRLHRYRVEYEVGKKDAQIAMQKQKTAFWKFMVGAVAVLLVAIVSFYIFYSRRRNLFYRRLVGIYKERLAEKSRNGTGAPLSASGSTGQPETPAQSETAISDEKADAIFSRISEAMEQRHVYRDSNLTRESFAKDVGVNRTYFSEIIKRKTGLSYSQYIAEARVREAAIILSDPADRRSLKEVSSSVGFVSMPTFFTAFKSVTGVPPAAFRKAATQ